jgi:methionyl-tRNA formyltransferase
LYRGKILKIHRATVVDGTAFSDGFGEIVESDGKEKIWVKTKKGILSILELQPEGKRKMSAGEFVRGYRLQVSEKLG